MVEVLFEKFRPKTFSEYIGHDDIIIKLKDMINNKRLSHILLYGPAGSGKTSVAHIFAHEILGDFFEFNFKEINASNERGVEQLRKSVIPFIKASPVGGDIKILLLDEVDGMLDESQLSLKRLMEEYPNTIFILTANNEGEIIKPIRSRCIPFFVGKLTDDELLIIVNNICNKENLNMTEEEKRLVIIKADGDARIVINILFGNVAKQEIFNFDKIPKDFIEMTKHVRIVVRKANTEEWIKQLFSFMESKNMVTEDVITLFADVDSKLKLSGFPDIQLMYLLIKLRGLKCQI